MPTARKRTAAKPPVEHGGFAARFAGDKFRVTCKCGLNEIVPWPQVGKLRVQHGG